MCGVLPSDLIFKPNFVKISSFGQVLKWGIAAECVTVSKVHDFPLSRKEENRLKKNVASVCCEKTLLSAHSRRTACYFFLFLLGFGFLPFVFVEFQAF